MAMTRKKLCDLLNRYKHAWILSYLLVYMVWFNYLEGNITTHFNEIHVTLDDYIPFCEYFVIPYILWFGYVAWGIIYTAIHNKTDFYKLCTVLFTGMTIFLIISTVYPNGHYLRPYYFSHHNFCTSICEWLYATDTPTNLFPSIHVYNSLAIHFAVINSKELENKKTVQIVSLILCISIILSTMFIKQHSVFDVSTALILGFLMYNLVYIRSWSKLPEKSTERFNNKKRLPQV